MKLRANYVGEQDLTSIEWNKGRHESAVYYVFTLATVIFFTTPEHGGRNAGHEHE